MKTRLKTSSENRINILLNNKNFRNNQNYRIGKKMKYNIKAIISYNHNMRDNYGKILIKGLIANNISFILRIFFYILSLFITLYLSLNFLSKSGEIKNDYFGYNEIKTFFGIIILILFVNLLFLFIGTLIKTYKRSKSNYILNIDRNFYYYFKK